MEKGAENDASLTFVDLTDFADSDEEVLRDACGEVWVEHASEEEQMRLQHSR